MSHPDLVQVKEMAKSGGSSVVMVGNRVYEASKYAPELVHFTNQKYLFLNHYYNGISIEESAVKANLDLAEAEVFVDSPKATEWLRKRAIRDFIRRDYEEGKWLEIADACVEGRKQLRKDQQVAFSALGERFAPKPKTQDAGVKTVINFNFTAKDVEDAFKRQASIDAEISQ